MKLKKACSLEGKLWQKSTETSLCRQRSVIVSYGFSSSHVWTWELDHKEGWMLKNWCFPTVGLEKTLESPLTARRSSQSVLKEINPEYSLEGLIEPEAPILWPPVPKNWLIGKDPDAGKEWRPKVKWAAEDKMVREHHWFNGHEFEQTPGDSGGQKRLTMCTCS